MPPLTTKLTLYSTSLYLHVEWDSSTTDDKVNSVLHISVNLCNTGKRDIDIVNMVERKYKSEESISSTQWRKLDSWLTSNWQIPQNGNDNTFPSKFESNCFLLYSTSRAPRPDVPDIWSWPSTLTSDLDLKASSMTSHNGNKVLWSSMVQPGECNV